jgi:hypothetical protein
MEFLQKWVLWEFTGLTPDVRAGLVPAQCGATTRVARTPRNPEDPKNGGQLTSSTTLLPGMEKGVGSLAPSEGRVRVRGIISPVNPSGREQENICGRVC